jgi:hypothetical protein
MCDSGKFSCSIDIGDPKTIKPISGKYKLTVLIADRHLAAPIQKELSTVSIKFKHEVSLDTLSDGFVVSSPDIIPTFPKKKEYSIIVRTVSQLR